MSACRLTLQLEATHINSRPTVVLPQCATGLASATEAVDIAKIEITQILRVRQKNRRSNQCPHVT